MSRPSDCWGGPLRATFARQSAPLHAAWCCRVQTLHWGFHQSRSCTKSQQDLFLQPSRAQKNLELPVWSWMAQRFLSKQESFPHVTFKENNAHVVQCRRCQRAQMDCMEGSQLSKLWLQAIRNSLTAWYIILLYYLIYWETHQPNRS